MLVHPGIVVPPELEAHYHRALANLQQHVLSHGLNKELLGSRARVYSVRLNRKGRLLIAPYRDEQARVSWVVLACLPDHKYESVYLRISQEVLEQKILDIRQACEHHQAMPPPEVIARGIADEEVSLPPELEFYQNRLIQLTTEQDQVVNARLPLVVNGVAGSGKSCIGLSVLRQASAEASITAPAVYVATSSTLVAQMQAIFGLTYGEDNSVLFLTYQALLAKVLGQVAFVGDDHLASWLETYMRVKKHTAPITLSVEQLSREFRQVCIFSECGDYLELGARHSSFSEEQKHWVFTAYQAYRAHLHEHSQVHPDLYHEGIRPLFSLVVADESQDLSPAALSTLSKLVPRDMNHAPQIVYLADANQSLENGNLLVLHHLSRLVGEGNIKTLPVSHRCPSLVIEYANRVLALRNSVSGGVYDKYTQSTLTQTAGEHPMPGDMVWTARYQSQWAALSQTTDFAVVTQPDYIEEARGLFNTPLVFTPTQIKGMEYKTVVVYRMLEGEHIKVINNRVKAEGIKSCVNRAKREELRPETIPQVIYLNELFTAFTRALYRLHVVQPVIHQNQHVMDFLNPAQGVNAAAAASAGNVGSADRGSPHESAMESSTAWEAELGRQLAMGNQDVAREIKQKLKTMTAAALEQNKVSSQSLQESDASTPVGTQPIKQMSSFKMTERKPVTEMSVTQEVVAQEHQVLSDSLANYVEGFFISLKLNTTTVQRKNNEANILAFLKNPKRAYVMLFLHPMQSGKTLITSLMEHDQGMSFKTCAENAGVKERVLDLLKQAMNTPSTSLTLVVSILRLYWVNLHHILHERLVSQQVEELINSLCDLVTTRGGMQLINTQWDYFKPFFTPAVLNTPVQKSTGERWNLFTLLVNEGFTFVMQRWNDIKRLLTKEGLNGWLHINYEGVSALFILTANPNFYQLLKEKWNDIYPFITPEGLNRRVEGGIAKGRSSILVLTGSVEGRLLLKQRWNDLKPYITKEGLTYPAEAGEDAGKSGLYGLMANLQDQLLINKWEDIRPFLTSENLNRPVENGSEKGMSPLFHLARWSDGRQFLKENWSDISPFLTAEGLNRRATAGNKHNSISNALFLFDEISHGSEYTKSPLCYLMEDGEFAQFLMSRWTEVYSILAPDGFNRPLVSHELRGVSRFFLSGYSSRLESEVRGLSLFYLLAINSGGYLFLREHWEEVFPLLTKAGLNQPLETPTFKGKSPVYWFTSTPEGRELLNDRWADVYSLLTSEGLNRPAETDKERGMTPLYWLTVTADGRQLLIKKWDEIKPLLTLRGLDLLAEHLSEDTSTSGSLLLERFQMASDELAETGVANRWHSFMRPPKAEEMQCLLKPTSNIVYTVKPS